MGGEKIKYSAAANDTRNFLPVSAGRGKREPAVPLLAPLQLRKAGLQDVWVGT